MNALPSARVSMTMLQRPPRRARTRAALCVALVALLLAAPACGDDHPTAPSPVLAQRYRLVAVGTSIVPAILDTTAQGERLLIAGTLEFVGATVGSSRPTAANRTFSFQSSEEENGVPRWIEGVQMLTGVRQSGRYVIFSLPGADGQQPPTVVDSAIIVDDGSLILRAAFSFADETGRRYDLLFEPAPADAAMRH